MRPTLVIAAAVAASALLVAGAAWACSCRPYNSAAEQFAQADVMFVGRVVSTTERDRRSATTRFEVLRTLKGQRRTDVDIRHPFNDGGAGCGVEFRPGQTVTVIAHEGEDGLATNLCAMPRFPLEDYEALSGENG